MILPGVRTLIRVETHNSTFGQYPALKVVPRSSFEDIPKSKEKVDCRRVQSIRLRYVADSTITETMSAAILPIR
jgi:hypothetical protein